jgi:hypothetical protein
MNPSEMTNQQKMNMFLQSRIEDILLDFASFYNEVTTGDLQGIAMVEAQKIIKLVRED